MRVSFCCSILCFLLLQNGSAQTAAPGNQPNSVVGNPITNGTAVGPGVPGANTTLEQLSGQLQSLRATVDQTLPALRAFNQQFSQQGQGLTGALENLFSKNRGSGQSNAGQQLTNVLSTLGSLVTTNAQGAAAVNPDTLRNLVTLEKDLGPIQQLLQGLALAGTNQPATPAGSILSPTGR